MMPLHHRDLKAVDLSYSASTVGSSAFPDFSATWYGVDVLPDVFVRFGQRLRAVRQRVGVSQEKLADMAELHRTYVSSVERGKRNISIQNIERLARALGVTMAELMPDDDKETSPDIRE